MRVHINTDEDYPVYYLKLADGKDPEWEIEVSEGFYEEYTKVSAAYEDMQKKLDDLFPKADRRR